MAQLLLHLIFFRNHVRQRLLYIWQLYLSIDDFLSCFLLGIYFGWMTPLLQLGYKKPITEKDVWKLDTWDQTEILIEKCAFIASLAISCPRFSKIVAGIPTRGNWKGCFDFCRFHRCWIEESQRSKPWLLRALNNSFGGRYWVDLLFLLFSLISIWIRQFKKECSF